ncbi:MAG: hypothetical protein IJW74_02950 [Oscillospiraceae bacterium]|nr:hypothetical protein [Oscillospiraceae bacterium]
MNSGILKKIKIFLKKGQPGEMVQKADCVIDLGLAGDRFAKGGEKQLTAISSQCEEWLKNQSLKGLCFERYKANLTIENLDFSQLNSGKTLVLGDAVLEVSSEKKECFAECERVQKCMECMLRTDAKYLKVSKSGTISVNDTVTI